MNVALKPMTVERYLDWLNHQPGGRFELVDGQVVPMNAQRVEHIETKVAVIVALKAVVRGLGYFALGDGMSVRIDDQTVFEPDALIYAGDRLKDGTLMINNPILVVEILSPGTKTVDTTKKLEGYFRLPTVRHYLIVDPLARTVVHHARDEGGKIETSLVDAGAIVLAALNVSVDVATLFPE